MGYQIARAICTHLLFTRIFSAEEYRPGQDDAGAAVFGWSVTTWANSLVNGYGIQRFAGAGQGKW